MTTFYICRHGETYNNKVGRFSGWVDTPLTEEGIQNAASTAAKLRGMTFDKIISSDLGRSFITAYLLSRKLGYSAEIGRFMDLREVNYGDFANLPYKVYPKLTVEENTNFVSPNGESLAQMQARVAHCIASIGATNKGKTVLIAAHDGTINAIRASFAEESMGQADLTHNAHDFVAKFEWDKDHVVSFAEVTG